MNAVVEKKTKERHVLHLDTIGVAVYVTSMLEQFIFGVLFFLCMLINKFPFLTSFSDRRQTEIVLEMTRYLTCQVLERRRGVSYKMPNLRAFMRQEQASRAEEGKSGVQTCWPLCL